MSYKIPSWLPRKEVEGLKLVNELLKHIGVKGVVVGTYALFLQDAAKPYETKDIEVYVYAGIIYKLGLIETLAPDYGLFFGRSEVGGIYFDYEGVRIELIYPYGDIYVPEPLLQHVVRINDLLVLEYHAVLIAKALAGVSNVSRALRYMVKPVSLNKLRKLLKMLSVEERKLVVKRLREVGLF